MFFVISKLNLRARCNRGLSLRGFSLVELMVTTLVLSLGILMVYQGFFTSLGGLNYCVDYLNAQLWMDEKIWDVQDKLAHYKTLLTEDTSGTFIMRNRQFHWELDYNLIQGSKAASLYEVNLGVAWKEGIKQVATQRTANVLYIEK